MSDQSAADRQAVADLVYRYALHIRSGEGKLAAGLFTADGVFEVRERDPFDPGSLTTRTRNEGLPQIEAHIGQAGGAIRMVPMIHNLLVELAGDTAAASSLMVGKMWPTPNEVVGEYADSFRREGGEWKFSERIYTIWRSPAA
jgi:hypothetical protein